MKRKNTYWSILYAALFIVLLQSCANNSEKKIAATPPPPVNNLEQGKSVFYTRCASCHKVNEELTGPALKGAEARWPDKQKLYAFIRNSDEVIKTDKYARELWLKYNQTQMLPQPDMTDEEIRAVLDYINSVSEK